MPFKYSAISDTVRRLGYSIIETPQMVLEAIKGAGFDAVDIPGDPQKINVRELMQLIGTTGLEVAEVQGAWAFHHAGESRDLAGDDVEARRRGIEYGKACIDLASTLGARYFEICSAQTPIPQIPFPELPLHTLRSNFLESSREICEYAARQNITVLFEPLNRYEAYPGVLTSVYDAINLINDLGLPNLGIQPDIYHMNIAEASIPDALIAAGKRIKVMHMNETNHYYMGEGHADYYTILKILKEINFDGYLSIYMPLIPRELSYREGSDDPTSKPDLQEVLEKQLNFLKAIERSVDKQRSIYRASASYITDEETEGPGETDKVY